MERLSCTARVVPEEVFILSVDVTLSLIGLKSNVMRTNIDQSKLSQLVLVLTGCFYGTVGGTEPHGGSAAQVKTRKVALLACFEATREIQENHLPRARRRIEPVLA